MPGFEQSPGTGWSSAANFCFQRCSCSSRALKASWEKREGKVGLVLTPGSCSSPVTQPAWEDVCWGMLIPWTAGVGLQDWEMGKEHQGYPELSLFTPDSTRSCTEQVFFCVLLDKEPFFPTDTFPMKVRNWKSPGSHFPRCDGLRALFYCLGCFTPRAVGVKPCSAPSGVASSGIPGWAQGLC